MWVHIEMASLDPDPYYWECEFRSKYTTAKITSQKETNLRFQVEKNIDHFDEGLMALTWAWKSIIKVYRAIYL